MVEYCCASLPVCFQPGLLHCPRAESKVTIGYGAKVKGRIFYVIPIRTTAVLMPANTITLVAVRVDDFGPKLSITLISVPTPNLVVIFTVRL